MKCYFLLRDTFYYVEGKFEGPLVDKKGKKTIMIDLRHIVKCLTQANPHRYTTAIEVAQECVNQQMHFPGSQAILEYLRINEDDIRIEVGVPVWGSEIIVVDLEDEE